jgi:hypothetical protein
MSSAGVCLQRSLIYYINFNVFLFVFILHHATLYMKVLSSLSLLVLVICTCNIPRFLSLHRDGIVTQRWRNYL